MFNLLQNFKCSVEALDVNIKRFLFSHKCIHSEQFGGYAFHRLKHNDI